MISNKFLDKNNGNNEKFKNNLINLADKYGKVSKNALGTRKHFVSINCLE